MATFNQGGSYSIVTLASGVYYFQGGHYFNSFTPFADLGTSQPSAGSTPMADQSPSAVSFTGGTIDGVVIGGTTPAAVSSTTLSASGAATLSSTLAVTGASTLTGGISSYNGISTVANGIAAEVAQINLTNQNANIGSTLLYAVPANGAGMYRAICYAVETTADGASSTLPNTGIGWTDSDSGVALVAGTVTPTNTANAAGAFGQGIEVFYAKASTNINYQTTNYASGTAGAMKYALHIRLEYLG
jgi:hypothetical protein